MRLLFVLNTLDERDGGPPAGVLALATQLAVDGHNVVVAARHQGEQSSKLVDHAEDAGVRILAPRPGAVPRGLVQFVSALRRWIQQADLVSLHGFYLPSTVGVGIICRVLKIPYVIQLHGSVEVGQDRVSSRKKAVFRKLGGQYVLRRSRALVLATEWERSHLPQYARGIPTVISGIAVSSGRGLAQQPEPGADAIVLFFGRIAEKKRLDILIDAMAILWKSGMPVRLRIAGAGDAALNERLHQQVEERGLERQVTWLGHVAAASKASTLSRAHIFCLPSMRENFGIAVAEACSVGLPVVITEDVALHTVVAEAGAGIIVSTPPTSSDVADALRRLISAPDLWKRCSLAGLELCEDLFSPRSVSERWLDGVAR